MLTLARARTLGESVSAESTKPTEPTAPDLLGPTEVILGEVKGEAG